MSNESEAWAWREIEHEQTLAALREKLAAVETYASHEHHEAGVMCDRWHHAKKERDHWRANAEELRKRNALLRNRTDLPLERVKGYGAMMAERDALLEKLAAAERERDAALTEIGVLRKQLKETTAFLEQLKQAARTVLEP